MIRYIDFFAHRFPKGTGSAQLVVQRNHVVASERPARWRKATRSLETRIELEASGRKSKSRTGMKMIALRRRIARKRVVTNYVLVLFVVSYSKLY